MMALRLRAKRLEAVAPPNGTPPQIIDINLMPVARRPAEISPYAVAVVVVLLLCIASMVPLALRVHDAQASATSMQKQADDAERGVRALQLNLTRQRGLASELAAAKAELAALQARREAFQGGTRPLEEDLTMLFGFGAFLPAGVSVSAITGADHTLKVDGLAPGPLDAIAYAERLATDGGFPSAQLVSFAPGTKDAGQFTIEVQR